MRARVSLAVLLAVMTLGGCGSVGGELPGSPRAATSSDVPVATDSALEPVPSTSPSSSPNAPPDHAEAFPQALIGTWISSSGGAEIIYQFAADGSYKYAGVLLQRRPSGMFSFTVAEAGTASVDDVYLLLQPRTVTKSMQDPDSPSSSYADRPASIDPKRLTWTLNAARTVLILDDGTNPAVDYDRQ
jgi:hypothetical protein